MICSSSGVPSVQETSACVSPRVKSTEPCWRGMKLGRIVISRTSSSLRPSMRLPCRHISRSTAVTSSSNAALTALVRAACSFSSRMPAESFSMHSALIASIAA